MKSTTKFKISNENLHAVFKFAGIDGVTEFKEISDGWYNSVFSAMDKNGKKYVIKIAPPKDIKVLSYEKNLMAQELEFYKLLNQHTTVKTAKILFSDFSGAVIPTPYYIMNFLDGVRLDKEKLTKAEKENANRQTAFMLTEFHKVKGEGYGYNQTGLYDNWKDALTQMTKMLIADAESFNKKCKAGKKLLDYIQKFKDVLSDIPCVFVNFDLHAKNLFCKKLTDGSLELSVLDLERGFFGDPIGDFVTPEALKPLTKKIIFKNYNRYVKITADKNVKIRFWLLVAYLSLIMNIERFSRFKGAGKHFSLVYVMGTLGSKILERKAFAALKKLSK